jgi:small subunit ribosomal protein S16
MGNRNRPFYRLVVTDSRAPRDGRFIDTLGHYDPLTDPAKVEIDEESVKKWIKQGAQISDTVRSLLKKEGIWARVRKGRPGTSDKSAESAAAPGEGGAAGSPERPIAKSIGGST